jgi:hypothetical protein
MDMILRAWDWLRRLPIGRWIGWTVKPIAVELIIKEGDRLQAEVMRAISRGQLDKIDEAFDKFQNRIKSEIWILPVMSARQKELVCRFVQEEGDRLQDKIMDAIKSGTPAAVNLVFDGFQLLLIKRVEAL